jgi:hypothetical protein
MPGPTAIQSFNDYENPSMISDDQPIHHNHGSQYIFKTESIK